MKTWKIHSLVCATFENSAIILHSVERSCLYAYQIYVDAVFSNSIIVNLSIMGGTVSVSSPLWDPLPFTRYTPEMLRQEIAEMQAQSTLLYCKQKIRIVVCGFGKVGKSASINNILSALEGRYTQPANTGGLSKHAVQKYIEYKMLVGDAHDTPYVLCEIPGFRDSEDQHLQQVQTEATKAAILGKFQPGDRVDYLSLTVEALAKMKTRQECAACVIFAFDSTQMFNDYTNSQFQFMAPIVEFAHTNEIKIACLLTKCDRMDSMVAQNVKNIYYSQCVEQTRHTLKQLFPGDRIFPIVNYTQQLVTDEGMMVPSLFALKHIMGDILSSLKRRVPTQMIESDVDGVKSVDLFE